MMKKNNIYYNTKIESLLKAYPNSKFFLITDDNLFSLYQNFLTTTSANVDLSITTIPEGEKAKTIKEYQRVVELLIKAEIRRNDVIVAFGGGVVGDLAGFVAATILRGVTFINIPTTLLAMVDSALGGKVGINSEAGKNLIGAFKNADKIIVNEQFLKTLPQQELINGYGEIVKAAFISDRTIFSLLTDDQPSLKLIKKVQKVKLALVKSDYFDKNKRQYLNFGHSFAHAIEKESNYQVPHGYAVFQGMEIALKIGMVLKITTPSDLRLLEKYFSLYQIKPYQKPYFKLLKYLKNDKKNTQELTTLILIKERALIKTMKEVELDELLSLASEL